ncbi:MAG TPA: hypothetical protein VFV67_03740 [Actinophytocola sp.]|uniref:hypothetical protein n=1 Tax=Actinophytocola sp. TaxID=1872138 RepID=UPI002DB93E57|nr:hypothetical protein [Actinophytocola sp.]HEU5469738.1 hypothetical protein [Actinophytocola sp.]
MSSGRSLANVRPWVLICLIGGGMAILGVLVLVGAHRELTGVRVAAPTTLTGSDYYVSANRRGSCTVTEPGGAAREIIVGRTTLASGTGARLAGPYPPGTTLSCNNSTDLTQGPITRLY